MHNEGGGGAAVNTMSGINKQSQLAELVSFRKDASQSRALTFPFRKPGRHEPEARLNGK